MKNKDDNYIHSISVKLISNDYKDILEIYNQLVNKKHFSTFIMCIYPYLILNAYEGALYFDFFKIENFLTSEDRIFLNNTRNTIKLFDEKFSKSIKIISSIDYSEHYRFSKDIKFKKFFRKINFYDNLGVYFSENKKIISNHQLLLFYYQYQFYDTLSKKEIINKQINNELLSILEVEKKIRKNSEKLGQILRIFDEGLSLLNYKKAKINNDDFLIYYKDFNTNKLFKKLSFEEKNLKLYLLHLLSILNFFIFYYNEIILFDNGFGARIKYISYDYVMKSLIQIKNKIKNNNKYKDLLLEIDDIEKNKQTIINKDFGNHMRHYGVHREIIGKNHLILSENINNRLCGLVEFFYDGMSCNELEDLLDSQIKRISNTIESYLNISPNNIQKL